jgi:hypothetical protein
MQQFVGLPELTRLGERSQKGLADIRSPILCGDFPDSSNNANVIRLKPDPNLGRIKVSASNPHCEK